MGLVGWLVAPHHVEQKEKSDLLEELMLLPENAVVRRINELVKRARSVKVHAYIIHYLRKQMPYMMGKQEKQVRPSVRPSVRSNAVGGSLMLVFFVCISCMGSYFFVFVWWFICLFCWLW